MFKLVYFLLIALSFSCQFKSEEEAADLIAGHKEVSNAFSVSVPSAGIRNEGDVLSFTLSFPYNVTVTNFPRLTLTIGAATVYANYLSGDGTKNLVFSYTILAGQNDSDGIAVASSVDLNGGTLTYTGTQGLANCSTSISVPSTSGVRVDTSAPTVSLVAPPADGTYYISQSLLFTVTMSEATVITGSPRLTLDVNGTTRYATYLSGSGTSTLLFNYVVQAADIDTNGIVVTTAIDANSGTLRDSSGNDATLTFAAVNTTNVDTNGGVPIVTAITPPANGDYGVGDNLDFVFTYSEPVNVTGFPTLTVTIGATGRLASYYSGSGSTQITFRYVVTAGEVDTNGITAAATLGMTGATIRDASVTNALNAFLMPSLTAVFVVDDRPFVSSFLYTNATTFIGGTLSFTALFNEAVTVTGTPRIPLTINTGGPVYATYVSGSGTTSLVFSYTVAEGTDDNNGIVITSPVDLNSGTITNSSGTEARLTFTQPSTGNVRISGIRPVINSINTVADGIYTTGQVLTFAVVFSEAVTANSTANVDLILDIGGVARTANYVSGSGTTTLNFSYTVDVADIDVDGISITSLTLLATASITDSGTTGNTATLTLPAINTSGILVNSSTPSIVSITSPANDTYILGEVVDFVIDYTEAVTVTGTPRLALTVGATTLYATYHSGSGSTALTFRYTVATGNEDSDGISAALVIDNNGGSINGALGAPADTVAPAQVLTGVLVDGNAPSIVSVTLPANSIYDTTDVDFSFQVVFDQVVTVTAPNPRIVLDIGGTTRYADYVSGTGSTTLTFTHTIDASDIDLDGITIANSNDIDLNGGAIQDANGNNAELALGSQDLTRVLVSYTGLSAWYDINDSSTLTTATCGILTCVSAITDKAGTGYNLSAAGTAQPELIASGFGAMNRAHLEFDNSTDIMNMVTINNMRTVIMVFETEAAAMTTQDLFYSTAGGANARVQITAGGNLSYGGTQTAAYSLNGSALSAAATTHATGLAASTPYILVVRFAGNQNPAANHRIGSTNFGGKFAEMMVFRSVSLSDAQLLPIINYLNAKHGAY